MNTSKSKMGIWKRISDFLAVYGLLCEDVNRIRSNQIQINDDFDI